MLKIESKKNGVGAYIIFEGWEFFGTVQFIFWEMCGTLFDTP